APPRFFAVIPPTATGAISPSFEILGRLLGGDEVLHPAHDRFTFGQIQPQGLHRQLLPFYLHHVPPFFGAAIVHANHFHSEFHARYLPRSISFANRWLASFRLKRFGSKGPYSSNRWSMLRRPSSITSRRISQVLSGRSGCAAVSMAMTASTCAGVPIDSPSFCRFSINGNPWGRHSTRGEP